MNIILTLLVLFFILKYSLSTKGKMIPDIPPNISFNENKNSNLKVEKIEIFGIDKVEKALEITLKFVGMKNPSLEFFFNPISNECKQIDNAEIHAIGINLKIGETFKVSNLYNVNGLNYKEREYLALEYLLGFNLCFNSNLIIFNYFIPLFEYEFNWRFYKNEKIIIKEEINSKIKLIEGVINNEHKNENAALIEEFNVPISIIKFRYENKWLKMLEMTVQFKKSGDYKLLLNRINDDCRVTENSIEFEETNRKANSISKRKFSNNGFNKGFILCFQYKFSEVKGIVEKVEKTVVDAGHNIVKTISTAPSEIVRGVDAVVFKGKEHLRKAGMFVIAGNRLASTGNVNKLDNFPNVSEFTSIKKQEEEQQAPSSSKISIEDLPIKFGIEKSSEKNEEKYKKVAQIKPLFYKGFVMRRERKVSVEY